MRCLPSPFKHSNNSQSTSADSAIESKKPIVKKSVTFSRLIKPHKDFLEKDNPLTVSQSVPTPQVNKTESIDRAQTGPLNHDERKSRNMQTLKNAIHRINRPAVVASAFVPPQSCKYCRRNFNWKKIRHKCVVCESVVCSKCSRRTTLYLIGDRKCRSCLNACNNSGIQNSADIFRAKDNIFSNRPVEETTDDTFSKDLTWFEFGFLSIHIVEGIGLIATDFNMLGRKVKSDPYCVVQMTKDVNLKYHTHSVQNSLNPCWNSYVGFKIHTPVQEIHFEVFDHDFSSKDDMMGSRRIRLSHLKNGVTYRGWLVLIHPAAVDKGMVGSLNGQLSLGSDILRTSVDETKCFTAGAIYIEVKFEYTARSKLRAFIQVQVEKTYRHHGNSKQVAIPPPSFDINAIYAPSMFLIDLIWNRVISPALKQFLLIIRWESWTRTIFIIVFWFYAFKYYQYWFSFLCWSIAIFMYYNFIINKVECISTHNPLYTQRVHNAIPKDDDDEEIESMKLNAVVAKFALIIPRWLKDTLSPLQPILQNAVEVASIVFDILHWEHLYSKYLFAFLIILGCVIGLIPHGYILYFIGYIVLFSLSPFVGPAIAIVKYLSRPKSKVDAESLGLYTTVPEFCFSAVYKKVTAIKNKSKNSTM